jgi:hypothetical protein
VGEFSKRRNYSLTLALGCLLTLAATGRHAWAQADLTRETGARLLKRAYVATRDSPLGQTAEASQIIAALRSSTDKNLLPLFMKLRKDSKLRDNQAFGMVASAILAKQSGMDPEQKEFDYVDLPLLFSVKDTALMGSAVASLIDARALSVANLKEMMTTAPDNAYRAMAAGELNRLNKLDDRPALAALLKSEKELVRYYAAVTMLAGPDAEQKAALECLKTLTAAHDLRQAPVQALMLVRMQKENIPAGAPWAVQIAADDQCDEGLRYTAVATALSFKAPEAPAALADMIQKQRDSIQQVKLGLISIEYAAQLKPAMLTPLLASKSVLAKSIAEIAQKANAGTDVTPDLLTLLKEGHPIISEWALAYSDRADPPRRSALRTAIVSQSTIVDNVRDRDFERAALAAQKLLADDGDAGRKTVAGLLKSDNRAVVEATLGGIFRSDAKNQSELVLAVWDGLTKTTSMENATNYAALILAREGHKEALDWLPGMIRGGTAQGPGIRALAAWYYVKLNAQTEPFLNDVIAN